MPAVTRCLRARLPASPAATSYALVGAAVAGGLGAVAGLVVGLIAYAPTAWFAVFELGVPAALAGALLGFLAGAIAMLIQRRRTR